MLLSSFFTRSMVFAHIPRAQLLFALLSETFLTIRQNSLNVTVCMIARSSCRGYFIHSLSTLYYYNAPSLATRLTGDYRDRTFTGKCGPASLDTRYKNRRSFLNVYIIERLVLSHIFYFNRYNSCLSPCIFVVFITCVIYNLHVVGKKSLIDIPHWPEHYEVLSYHFWPAYRQNRLSVFVPEDRYIPPGEI